MLIVVYLPEKERFWFLKFCNVTNIDFLDVGMGKGALSIIAAGKKKCQVTGIDCSNHRLEHAKKQIKSKGLAKRIFIEQQDARNLSYPDNSFTCVACYSCLHHVGLHVREKVIQEMVRVAKERVIISELTPFGAKYVDLQYHPKQIHQKNIVSIHWIKERLKNYGKITESTRLFTYFIRMAKR